MDNINVVFTGRIREGFEASDVREKFASQFQVPSEALDKIFDGDEFTLNRNLDQPTADKLCAVLRHVGMVVRIEQPELDFSVDMSAFIDDDDSDDAPDEEHDDFSADEADLANVPEEHDSSDPIDDIDAVDDDDALLGLAESAEELTASLDSELELVPLDDDVVDVPLEGRAEYQIDESAESDSGADETALEDAVDELLDDALDEGELSLEPLAELDELEVDADPEPQVAALSGELNDAASDEADNFIDDLDLDAELGGLSLEPVDEASAAAEAGLEIESIEPLPEATEAVAVGLTADADQPDENADLITCANCGHQQPMAEECSNCGAKLAPVEADSLIDRLDAADLDEGSPWKAVIITLAVLAAIGAGIVWALNRFA